MSNLQPTRPRQVTQRRTFAVVASRYNYEYVQGLIENVKREMASLSPGAVITVYEVPGSFEIPLVVQEVAARGGVDGILALGVLIQGETAHAGLVAQVVTDSLQRLALHYKVPVINEVLLVADEGQARARCLEPTLNRGVEAARAAVGMSNVLQEMRKA